MKLTVKQLKALIKEEIEGFKPRYFLYDDYGLQGIVVTSNEFDEPSVEVYASPRKGDPDWHTFTEELHNFSSEVFSALADDDFALVSYAEVPATRAQAMIKSMKQV